MLYDTTAFRVVGVRTVKVKQLMWLCTVTEWQMKRSCCWVPFQLNSSRTPNGNVRHQADLQSRSCLNRRLSDVPDNWTGDQMLPIETSLDRHVAEHHSTQLNYRFSDNLQSCVDRYVSSRILFL